MGIVRLSGRDVMRLSTDAREREERLASSEARGIGPRHVVQRVATGGNRALA